MKEETSDHRSKERMRSSKLTRPDTPPYEVQGHLLLCAVCVRGGCEAPLPGKEGIERLLKSMWKYPYLPLKITGDVDVTRAHYSDVYENRGGKPLPDNFKKRRMDYAARKKDLEVIRRLGIAPNTVLPAYHAYKILFSRAPTLDGICRTGSKQSEAWPECPYAREGYYERIAGANRAGLKKQTELGEDLDGKGLWAMVRLRTREDMNGDKAVSAKTILEEAERLYVRPSHLLCILCAAGIEDPLIQDNLIELRRRMEAEPDIPVTLTEGCCMVCDSCNVYHPGEHLCYHGHIKSSLRDLMVLEKLGFEPGKTLPAKEIYGRVYERIAHLHEICAWGDGANTAPFWSPCGGIMGEADNRYQTVRKAGLISGKAG